MILRGRRTPLDEQVALAFGLGAGFHALQLFVVSWLGFRLSASGFWTLLAADFCVLLALGWRSIRGDFSQRFSWRPQNLSPIDWILCAAIVVNVVLIFINAVAFPIASWDALAIWSYKAKVVFHESIRHSAYFGDPTRSFSHPEYPLLVPFLQSYAYYFIGMVDERLVRLVFASLFACLLLSLFSVAGHSVSRSRRLFLTAIMATTPCFVIHSISGYADVPLAFFCFLMTRYAYLWIQEGDWRHSVLAGIFAAFTVHTKNEGMALFLINLGVLALFACWNPKKERVRHLILFFVIAAILITPWLLFQQKITVVQDDYASRLSFEVLGQNAGRIPGILSAFFKEFIHVREWSVFWFLAAILFGLRIRAAIRPPISYLTLVLAAHFGLYVLTYWITSWNPEELIPYTITRLLIHIAPVALLLMCQQVESGD